MAYSFDSKKHIHSLDGIKLRGVTSIIGSVIAKPALIGWAVKVACEYIKENLKDLKDLDAVLEQAKKAHTKKKTDAGSSGTDVHKAIEDFIKDGSVYKGDDKIVADSFNNFLSWVHNNSVVFLESEKNIYSKDLLLGGIIDGVVLMDGKKWIYDTKTGSGIYSEAFIQCAAYDLMIDDKIDGYVILNLRKDGGWEEKRTLDIEGWKNCFKACLTIYEQIR